MAVRSAVYLISSVGVNRCDGGLAQDGEGEVLVLVPADWPFTHVDRVVKFKILREHHRVREMVDRIQDRRRARLVKQRYNVRPFPTALPTP